MVVPEKLLLQKIKKREKNKKKLVAGKTLSTSSLESSDIAESE